MPLLFSCRSFFPLWYVPYRRVRDYEWVAAGYLDPIADDDLFIDIAIYGCEQAPGRNFYAELEQKLIEVTGLKTLISHNFYDEVTFWKIWNRPNYDRAKAILDRRNLQRDLYEKTCRAMMGWSRLAVTSATWKLRTRPSRSTRDRTDCLGGIGP